MMDSHLLEVIDGSEGFDGRELFVICLIHFHASFFFCFSWTSASSSNIHTTRRMMRCFHF